MQIVPQDCRTIGMRRTIKADRIRTWQRCRHLILRCGKRCRVIFRHEGWCQAACPRRRHAAGPGQISISKIQRWQLHMRTKIIIPARRRIGRRNNFPGNRQACILIGGKRRWHVLMRCQCLNKRNRIFHCKPCSRSDRKMRCVRRITQYHLPSGNPACTPQPRKHPPGRFVGHQTRTAQNITEQIGTSGCTVIFVHRIEAMRRPCLRPAFNNKCAAVRGIAIVMRIHRTVFGMDKTLGQRIKHSITAEPGKVVCKMVDGGGKTGLVGPAYHRVQSIRANDDIRLELVRIINGPVIGNIYPQISRPRFQQLQQFQPPDRAEANPVKNNPPVGVVQGHIVPAFHPRVEVSHCLRVAGRQKIQGLV